MPEQHNTEVNVATEANEALGEMMKAIWLAASLASIWKDLDLDAAAPKGFIHWQNINAVTFGELRRLCGVAMDAESAVDGALRKLEKLEGVSNGS